MGTSTNSDRGNSPQRKGVPYETKNKNCCCEGCIAPKRHPGCHDKCSDYIKYRNLRNEENAEKFQKSEKRADIDSFKRKAIKNMVEQETKRLKIPYLQMFKSGL